MNLATNLLGRRGEDTVTGIDYVIVAVIICDTNGGPDLLLFGEDGDGNLGKIKRKDFVVDPEGLP